MKNREYEFSLFPTLEQFGIGFVAFSPLANGFLSDRYDQNSRFEPGTDYRSFMPQFKAESVEVNQVLLELLRKTATEKGATPAQISLAWVLAKKPWIVRYRGHVSRIG
ncbi:aldo/keto reductase [Paradesulfitobacterium ferrireducens]|uniref:aldo/keto reductase n=1 Tax=Paradesulfitobacterium ferrireducens TaxID=2816476 RepID=UPI002E289928|nr:aldo/keto reductase [Paradesulfitobacterium ferrireducens]